MLVRITSAIVINAEPSIHATAVPTALTKSDPTPLNAGMAVPKQGTNNKGKNISVSFYLTQESEKPNLGNFN